MGWRICAVFLSLSVLVAIASAESRVTVKSGVHVHKSHKKLKLSHSKKSQGKSKRSRTKHHKSGSKMTHSKKINKSHSRNKNAGIPTNCANGLPTLDQWRYTQQRLGHESHSNQNQEDLPSMLRTSRNTVVMNESKNSEIVTLLQNASKSHHLGKSKANKLLSYISNYSSNRPPDIVALEKCVQQYQDKKEEVVTKIDNSLFDSGFVQFVQNHRVQEKEQNFWPDRPSWARSLLFEHDSEKLHLKFTQADQFIVYPRIFDFDYATNSVVLEVVEGQSEDGEAMTYLPWAVDYVTHMQMFANTSTFMTGPLDGCNVYVARKEGELPVVMHANANHHNPGFLFNTRYKFCRALEVLRNDWPGYEFTHALQRQDYCRHPAKCGFTFVWGQKLPNGEWEFYRHFAQTGGTMDSSAPQVDKADSNVSAQNWALAPVPPPPADCESLLAKFL